MLRIVACIGYVSPHLAGTEHKPAGIYFKGFANSFDVADIGRPLAALVSPDSIRMKPQLGCELTLFEVATRRSEPTSDFDCDRFSVFRFIVGT